jgi:hypothetical protein
MTEKISSAVSIVYTKGNQSLQTDTADTYERLYVQIHELEKMARETFQYQFRRNYELVVEKLKNNEYLTDDDKKLITQLVVADAKSYVKYENDFENWKDEIVRLLSELKKVQDKGINSTDDLLHIQALCRDLRSVLPDITFYLSERERIQGYEKNDLNALPPELKSFLADFVKGLMESDKM